MATLTTFTANTQIKSAEVNGNFTGLSDGTMDTDHNSLQIFRDEGTFDYVGSGGVWTADSAGVNRNASMTALIATIDGWRNTIAAVTSRTFTASKDTYVDVLRSSTTLSLVYTEVSNNAASPALASNSLRLAIIVTGATTIAAATSINQGQQDRVLPIASSIPYQVCDSLGNLICPRDPLSKILGYRQITSNFTDATGSFVDITGLSCPVIVPTGRKVKITFSSPGCYSSVATDGGTANIYDSTASAEISEGNYFFNGAAGSATNLTFSSIVTPPSSGARTYKSQFKRTVGGTATLAASSTQPVFLLVELA